MKYSLLIFSVAVFLMSCSKSSTKNTEPEAEYSLSVAFKDCKTVTVAGEAVTVCFNSMNDSRCPSNVVCPWQGVVTPQLSLNKNGNVYAFTLSGFGYPPYKDSVIVAGYKIKLIDVTPYPVVPPPAVTKKIELKIQKP